MLNDEEDEEAGGDDNTDYTHQMDGGLVPPLAGYFADSADNLLLTGMGNDGVPYQSPNAQYDFGGPQNRGVWGSDYDKKEPRSPGISSLGYSPCDTVKESGDMVVKEAPNAVVEQHMACLSAAFLAGLVDFRKMPRCQVQSWLLIFFLVLLMASIVLKCLSSFSFRSNWLLMIFFKI